MSTELLTILFGIGVLQVLLTAPGGLVDQVPKDLAKLGRAIGRLVRAAGAGAVVVIEVDELTVRFGGVVPIDRMTLTFPGGTCGLIGPNGAGKTTFFNVLSGFVRPIGGTVSAFGEDLLAMADFRRARWGVRRTFQTEQAIADLSVFDNVLLVHEHTGGVPRDAPRGRHGRGRLRRPRARRRRRGRHARRRPAAPRRGRPGRRRHAAAGAARRAGGRPARRGDRAPRPS